MKARIWKKLFLPITSILTYSLALGFSYSFISQKDSQQQDYLREKTKISDDVQLNYDSTYKNLQLGESFSGVVATDKSQVDHLYLWGHNNLHRVSESKNSSEPNLVKKKLPENKIKHLALGKNNNAGAVTTDELGHNHLYVWGYDEYGETGKGSSGLIRNYQEIKLKENVINNFALGYNHGAIVTTDENDKNHLYLMGLNNYGQLGSSVHENSYTPLEINFLEAKIKDLSLGYYHSSVVTTDQEGNDQLYLWGYNSYQQIGNGNKINQKTPSKISLAESKIKKVSLGRNHSSVVTTDQEGNDHLYLWGNNWYGQLGYGDTSDKSSPTKISLPEQTIKNVSLGQDHSSVVTTNQEGEDQLYLWGNNSHGQIGNGSTLNQLQPTKISLLDSKIKNVSLGHNYSGIITTNEKDQDNLYLWGDNYYGQLGNGKVPLHHKPAEISFPERKIHGVNLGYNYSSVITMDKKKKYHLYMWGDNYYGQLGNGNTIDQHQPVKIPLPEDKIKRVSLGNYHSSVITLDKKGKNHLYLWGNNWYGQLGNGNTKNQNIPTKISLPEIRIKTVSLGHNHSSVVTTDHNGHDHLYLWGSNLHGQLGTGNTIDQHQPVKIPLRDKKIKRVSLGYNHSSVITTDQEGNDHLYMWGDNYYGQLGNGNNINQHLPIEIPLPGRMIKSINLKGSHSSAVIIGNNWDEHLYLWGNNQYGQLGNGKKVSQNKPMRIYPLGKWIYDLSLGQKHSSAISSEENGRTHLYLWGNNQYGQLGNGNTINQHRPIEIFLPEQKMKAVSAGNYHSGVITTDQDGKDHFYLWGYNYYGQLGSICKKFITRPIKISNTREAQIFDKIELNKLVIWNNQISLDLAISFEDLNLVTTRQIEKKNTKIYVRKGLEISYTLSKTKNNILEGKIKITGLKPRTSYDNLSLKISHILSNDNHQITIPLFTTLN